VFAATFAAGRIRDHGARFAVIEPFGGQANLLDDSVGDSEGRIRTTDCTRGLRDGDAEHRGGPRDGSYGHASERRPVRVLSGEMRSPVSVSCWMDASGLTPELSASGQPHRSLFAGLRRCRSRRSLVSARKPSCQRLLRAVPSAPFALPFCVVGVYEVARLSTYDVAPVAQAACVRGSGWLGRLECG
jgi:hypothetical protein